MLDPRQELEFLERGVINEHGVALECWYGGVEPPGEALAHYYNRNQLDRYLAVRDLHMALIIMALELTA